MVNGQIVRVARLVRVSKKKKCERLNDDWGQNSQDETNIMSHREIKMMMNHDVVVHLELKNDKMLMKIMDAKPHGSVLKNELG